MNDADEIVAAIPESLSKASRETGSWDEGPPDREETASASYFLEQSFAQALTFLIRRVGRNYPLEFREQEFHGRTCHFRGGFVDRFLKVSDPSDHETH